MRRPIVFISIALSIALAASLVVGWAANRESKTKPKPIVKAQDNSTLQKRTIPDHLLYWHVFDHKMMLDKKAEEVEKQGRSGSAFRTHYKTAANLSDREAQIFDRVAEETYEKVKTQDANAKKLIDEIRSKGADGFIKPGELKPELIEKLKAMQNERDEMIMNGVNKLRAGFGPELSPRFDQFVKGSMGRSVKDVKQVSLPPHIDPRTDPRVQQMLNDQRRSK